MGEFTQPLTLIGPQGEVTVEALVDTGATFSYVDGALLRQIGVTPVRKTEFVLADGSVVEYNVGFPMAQVDGEQAPTVCVFGDPGSQSLLGAITLEALLLMVDPIDRRLIRRRGNLL